MGARRWLHRSVNPPREGVGNLCTARAFRGSEGFVAKNGDFGQGLAGPGSAWLGGYRKCGRLRWAFFFALLLNGVWVEPS